MRFKVVFFELLDTLIKVERLHEEIARLLASELRLPAQISEIAEKVRTEWTNKYNMLISKGAYRSLRQLAREVVISVVKQYTLSLSPQEVDYFSNAISSIFVEQAQIYDDVPETVSKLSENNIDMYILTNLDNDIAKKILLKHNMLKYFKGVISSDLSRAGKPSLRIYQAALTRAKAYKDECVLVSGLLEDIIGSKLVGLKIIFVNRGDKKTELVPDYTVSSLREIIPIVLGSS
ncbi:MAG: HAD family hydrolase [Crenarchaeota archaeon]|nr:HAD family hydrolase [Thermoproteota archaeon]